MIDAYLAYHNAEVRGPFSGLTFETGNSVPLDAVLYVVSGDKQAGDSKKTFSLEGSYQVSGLRTDIHGSKKYQIKLSPRVVPEAPIVLNAHEQCDGKLLARYLHNGVQKFPSALQDFKQLLEETLSGVGEAMPLTLIEDYRDIECSDLSETEKAALRSARIGQGKFRRAVITTWGGLEQCAVTGIKIPQLLNASHIRPWRDCETSNERLAGSNGILLSANLDRLFDRYLLGFKKTLKPDVRELVLGQELAKLSNSLAVIGIRSGMKLDMTMVRFSEVHEINWRLDEHLEKVLG